MHLLAVIEFVKRYQDFFVCCINPKVNPVPTRLCHVIYYHGDKKYPCVVGIGLMCEPKAKGAAEQK